MLLVVKGNRDTIFHIDFMLLYIEIEVAVQEYTCNLLGMIS